MAALQLLALLSLPLAVTFCIFLIRLRCNYGRWTFPEDERMAYVTTNLVAIGATVVSMAVVYGPDWLRVSTMLLLAALGLSLAGYRVARLRRTK
jgi:hypothetical protein